MTKYDKYLNSILTKILKMKASFFRIFYFITCLLALDSDPPDSSHARAPAAATGGFQYRVSVTAARTSGSSDI
jgi:hypothetical protein